MKKLLQLILILCTCQLANAQYYYLPYPVVGQNPGNINQDGEYPVGGGLPAGWVNLLGPTNATPVWSATQTLPFSFSFNGAPVTQFKVSSSAILTFDVATAVTAPSYTKAALPSALIPNNSVCIWGLAGKGTNDYVVSKTFGTAPNRQFWVEFTSYGYGATASSGSAYTYWSIVLEETTNNIYIVDERVAGYTGTALVSAGIQINSTTAYSVAGSPNLAPLATSDGTPADNSYYQFIQGTQPDFDASISNITTSAYVAPGSNNISGEIKNFGTSTITSFTANYKVASGAVVSSVITGVTIPSLSSTTFTSSIPWVETTPGAYVVECYATNLNGGNVDQNLANDKFTKTINILLSLEQRIPMFEIFTSSTCPPCLPGNLNFHSIVDTINQDEFVSLKFQQDFPGTGDPYTTSETVSRRSGYYGINSIPRMENDGGWDGNANSFTYGLYQDARNTPAQYKMNGSYTADTVSKTYSANIRFSPLFPSTGTNLYVVIAEGTTSLNVKTNSETEFFHVMKKMLPDETGTALANIALGAWDSVTVTYTFNGNYRLPIDGQAVNVIDNTIENSVEEFSDLRMMGWLQATDGTKQIFQAANFVLDAATGVYSMNKSVNSIAIFPNPTSDFAKVEISLNDSERMKIQLMDAQGRSIEVKNIDGKSGVTTTQFNVSGLAAGVYHVAVSDSKNNSFVKRIVVSK